MLSGKSIAIGAGAAGLLAYFLFRRDNEAPCETPALKDKHGTLSSNDGVRTCARAGIASNPKFVWTVSGTSASQIAKDITGSELRYVELIKANPEKPTLGDALRSRATGYNFASLQKDEPLRMPQSWNVFIDETGTMTPTPGVPFPSG